MCRFLGNELADSCFYLDLFNSFWCVLFSAFVLTSTFSLDPMCCVINETPDHLHWYDTARFTAK